MLGTGAALPGQPVPTDELLAAFDGRFGTRLRATGHRLAARLGVQTRHLCRDVLVVGEGPRPGDSNPELAARAITDALAQASLCVEQLGYAIGHTTTPHTLLPSNIAWVADHLSFSGPFVELRQACTGFAQALQLSAGLLLEENDRPIAIVGSETGSVFLDPMRASRGIEQLLNLIQMGDGAGAIVLARDRPGPAARISHAFVGALGPGMTPGFWLEAGGSSQPYVEGIAHFRHDAARVRKRGADLFNVCIDDLCSHGFDLKGIDWFLPHQANATELPEAIAKRLEVPIERVLVTADRVGNLGSASIWVGLDLARRSGRLKQGDRVLVLGAEATKYLYGGFIYEHDGTHVSSHLL